MTGTIPTTLSVYRAGDRAVVEDTEIVHGKPSPLRSYSFSAEDALIIGRELVRIGSEIAREEQKS